MLKVWKIDQDRYKIWTNDGRRYLLTKWQNQIVQSRVDERQVTVNEATLKELAKDLGIDRAEFRKLINSKLGDGLEVNG
jgi:uncharacterized protein YidB (DUF937 family)